MHIIFYMAAHCNVCFEQCNALYNFFCRYMSCYPHFLSIMAYPGGNSRSRAGNSWADGQYLMNSSSRVSEEMATNDPAILFIEWALPFESGHTLDVAHPFASIRDAAGGFQ